MGTLKELFKILNIDKDSLFSYSSHSDAMDTEEFCDMFEDYKFKSTDQFIKTVRWLNEQVNSRVVIDKVLKKFMKSKKVSDDMKLWYRLDGVNGINSKT